MNEIIIGVIGYFVICYIVGLPLVILQLIQNNAKFKDIDFVNILFMPIAIWIYIFEKNKV